MTRHEDQTRPISAASPDAAKTSTPSSALGSNDNSAASTGNRELRTGNPGTPQSAIRNPQSKPSRIDDDVRYHLFKLLEERPEMTQRDAAEALGMSLGKVNYCFRALMKKGWVKARNFKNAKKKIAYAYLLTPQGIEEKVRVTRRFLDRKLREYDALVDELHELTDEVNEQRRANGEPEVDWQPAGVPKGGGR